MGCRRDDMTQIVLSNGVVLFAVHGIVYTSLHEALEALRE